MKDDQGTTTSSQRVSGQTSSLLGGTPPRAPARGLNAVNARPAVLRVLIRPARPDDLEEATLVERRVWGRLGASLNELQRRLFALPEAFLLAELQRRGGAPPIVRVADRPLAAPPLPRLFRQHRDLMPQPVLMELLLV